MPPISSPVSLKVNVTVNIGNVLDCTADVLISTANPWLNMSGGVNGAILERCPEIQAELRDYLAAHGLKAVPPETVVRTSAGSLPFAHIIHAVAIDPFYDSSIEVVRQALVNALDMAVSLGARSVATPCLATGYGHLTIESFAKALALVVANGGFDLELTVVVRSSENAGKIRSVLAN